MISQTKTQFTKTSYNQLAAYRATRFYKYHPKTSNLSSWQHRFLHSHHFFLKIIRPRLEKGWKVPRDFMAQRSQRPGLLKYAYLHYSIEHEPLRNKSTWNEMKQSVFQTPIFLYLYQWYQFQVHFCRCTCIHRLNPSVFVQMFSLASAYPTPEKRSLTTNVWVVTYE